MAMLMLAAGATVTLCNSKTRDLGAQTRRADVLVVATGKPGMVTGDMIKPGAVVIDVGINRNEQGKLVGDVDFQSAVQVAGDRKRTRFNSSHKSAPLIPHSAL